MSLEDAPTLYFSFISSWRLVPGRLLSDTVLFLELGSGAHLSSWEWDEEQVRAVRQSEAEGSR